LISRNLNFKTPGDHGLMLCDFILSVIGIKAKGQKECLFLNVICSHLNCNRFLFYNIKSVPGIKVTTSGFISRADSESKTSYTLGFNSRRFRSYEFLKYSK